MGLPTTANYLVTSTTCRSGSGRNRCHLPAHLFVFYFGIIADLTPPVALAAMAGAGVARARPLQTAVTAFKLGAPAYLIPYVFCYAPQITLVVSLHAGAAGHITALMGVVCLGLPSWAICSPSCHGGSGFRFLSGFIHDRPWPPNRPAWIGSSGHVAFYSGEN